MRVSTRVRRLAAVTTLTLMALGFSTQNASAEQLALPALHLPAFPDLGAWLTTPNWGKLPQQAGGSAAGLSHTASAASTHASGGAGNPRGKGAGELPPYQPRPPRPRTGPGSSQRVASGFDAATSVRIAAKSSATMNYFQNTDGTVTRKYSQTPVNYQDAAGAWQPIDTTVEHGADGRWHEKANSAKVDFAPTATDPTLTSLAVDGSHSVAYSVQGAAPVTPKVSGSNVTYGSILPSTDLQLAPNATGVKESIVLRDAHAPTTWTFPLKLTGLTPKLAADGSVDLVDSAGAVRERVPHGYAFDSKHATTDAVSYELATVDGVPALKVSLDKNWLADGKRVFPVTVDPTFTLNPTSTYVQKDSPGDHSMEQTLKVGSTNGGADSALAFLAMPKDIDNQHVQVTSASLSLFDTYAANCTPTTVNIVNLVQPWTPTTVTYPGPGGANVMGAVAPNVPNACTNPQGDRSRGDWVTIPLTTDALNAWSNGSQPDYGVAIVPASYTDPNQRKEFASSNMGPEAPYLTVTTAGNVPPQIDTVYPPNNGFAATTTPWLEATAHDPDHTISTLMDFDFQVVDANNTTVIDSGTVHGGASWQVPAGKLQFGQTYYWTVATSDGQAWSDWSAWTALSIQVPQPVVTSSLSQNNGDHGFDPGIGNYTTSATDAEVQSAGPALAVTRDYNSRDPRTGGAFGAGWSSVFDAKATELTTTDFNNNPVLVSTVISYPDGSEVGFGLNTDGSFSSPQGRFAVLRALPNKTGYTLTDKNDTVYTFGQALSTGGFGISSITDANGRAQNFTWAGGHITTATSATSGRALHFTWSTPSGASTAHVATVVTDPVTAGQSSTALTWTYNYTGDNLASVCAPGAGTACTTYGYQSTSQYMATALDIGPHSLWPLGEQPGAATAVSAIHANEGNDNGTYNNVALGQPGALVGSTATSAGFNGTSSYVQLPTSLSSGWNGSAISMWFKTSATNGVLYSYSGSAITNNTTLGDYVPALYVGSDGKLNAEFWYGGGTPMVSKAAVNDNQWHHVVLQESGNSQGLYLDGVFVDYRVANIPLMANFYRYIGTGFLGGTWPDESHQSSTSNTGYASYFNGSIADVALWDKPVSSVYHPQLYQAGLHASTLLTSVTRPSGNVHAQVTYDPVSGAVQQLTDENGGVWKVGAPTVTGSSQVYRSAVLGAGPLAYYRLGDNVGAAQAVSEVKYGAATYNAATLGSTGPFQDATAAAFNGTSSYAQLPADTVSSSSQNLSAELWFSTTTGGGILVGANANQLGPCNATACTPILWVGTDGKLYGNFYTSGGAPQLVSSKTVTDGGWHHAVISASSSSQSLYLDGDAAQTKTTSPLTMTGYNYAYLGAGAPGLGWNGLPANNPVYFKGSIADAVFYRTALSSAQVAQHFNAAKNSQGLLPVSTVKITDPGGKTLTYQYDLINGNRKVSETDGLGNKTSYGYDSAGFLNTVTDPNGVVNTTGHDVRGNTVSQTTCQNQAAGICSTAYFTYFPDDTTKTLSPDARNDVMLTVRDGRSSSATDNTYLTSYGYDAKGNRTSITTPPVPGFPNGRTTSIAYTAIGLPTVTTSPGGTQNTITYATSGDVQQTQNAEGLVTKFTYDGVGRVATKTEVSDSYPNGLVTTYGYDGQDHVTSQADPVVTDRITGATHNATTTSVYDADGNITSQTVADGTGGDASRTSTSTYNTLGELASSTDPSGNTTTFTYDAYGHKASDTDPNGAETDFTYDADGHELTQSIQYTGSPLNPHAAAPLVEKSTAYDPTGRVASETDSMGNKRSYTYFDNGLKATETRTDPTGANSFIEEQDFYDAAGNQIKKVTNNLATVETSTVDAADRTTQTVTDPGGLNRTTTVSYTPDDKPAVTTMSDSTGAVRTTTATYDPMGNPTSQSLFTDGAGRPAGWWQLNQTTGATVPDSSGNGGTAAAANVSWANGAGTFNGTNSTVTTNGPVLDTTGNFTVSAWANLSSTGKFATVVGQDATQCSGFFLQYSATDNAWAFAKVNADVNNATGIRAHDTAAPALNTWTHLVGTYTAANGQLSLYVNGVLAGTATVTTPYKANGPLTIGRGQYNAGPADYFPGSIGNVQVYQRVLTPAEISTLAASQTGGTTASSHAITMTRTLDQRGLPTSATDPDGNTTNYSYDEAGHLAVTTSPVVSVEHNGGTATQVHPVTMTGYNTFGEATERDDPNGNVSTTVYDAAGRPVSITQPNYTPPGGSPITAVTVKTYDKLGNLVQVSDPLSRVTKYVYDQLGDQVRTTDPAGNNIDTVYDTNGDKLSVTDQAGAQTQATYDYLGRQITSTTLERYPSTITSTTTNSYAGSPGNAFLASTTTQSGANTQYGYDALGEKTSITDPAGNITRSSYDFLGRKTSTTLADGSSTATTYDTSGNPVSVAQKDPSGAVLATSSATFDDNGFQLSTTDALGHTSRFTHDATGAVTQEVQPTSATSSITTSFGYDTAGNRTRFTDGRGNATIYTYTPWNLKESVIEPTTATYSTAADSTFTTAYDADGEPVSQTQPGGVTITATYDAVGNLLTQNGSGADGQTAARTFGYDSVGRMTSAATSAIGTSVPASNETFTYNDRDELLTASGSAGSSSFGYNADGLMTTRTDASGTSSYGYDSADRLSTIQDSITGTQLTYGYNSLDQVNQVKYGSGNQRTFGYDGLHRLASDTLKTSGGATVASIGYGYDLNGNLTSKTTTGFAGAAANTYTYDQANRLTSWNNGSSTVNYAYDASGNRTQVGSNVYTYDARDQLTSDGVNSYTYTARGTMSSQTNTSGTQRSTSDAFGQMTSQNNQSYTYDALGRALTDTGTTFSYSGMTNTPSSDGVSTYSYDPSGGLVGIGGGGVSTLAFVDQHTDVVGDFTANGTSLSGSTTYDPLGNVTSTSNQAGRLGFQSGWTDTSTGKVNMAARWYSPQTGQFMNRDTASPDPMPNSAAANPFAYVDDDPLTRTDPSGHGWFSDFVSSAFHAVTHVVQAVTHYVAVHVVQPVVHAVQVVVHAVADAYHAVARAAARVVQRVVRVARVVYHAAVHVVKTAYHAVSTAVHHVVAAVKTAAKAVGNAVTSAAKAVASVAKKAVATATNFVKAHASTIAGIAVGIGVGLACTVATGGVGAIGCAALAGAAGNAVSYAMDCHASHSCSLGGAVEAVGLGALGGALGAGLAGPLGGKLVATALEDVMPKVAASALVGLGSGAASGAITSAVGYGMSCGSSQDGCSLSGAASAVGSGALWGGLIGGIAGAAGEAVGKSDNTTCHSFVPGTKVLMGDGTSKSISQVQVGDKVADSVPGDTTLQTHTVQKVIVTQTDHDFVNLTIKKLATKLGKAAAGLAVATAAVLGSAAPASADTSSTLTTTFHHPFYDTTQAAFVDAVDLHPGDRLQTADGGAAEVTSVRAYHQTETTYDLTIDGLHTYYVVAGAAPVLVHNCGADDLAPEAKASYDTLTSAVGRAASRSAQDIRNSLTPGQLAVGRALPWLRSMFVGSNIENAVASDPAVLSDPNITHLGTSMPGQSVPDFHISTGDGEFPVDVTGGSQSSVNGHLQRPYITHRSQIIDYPSIPKAKLNDIFK
ncbi:RHS repeat-associated protein [Kutzneria buriramensis]|uniref:RHS repeat-associated protein n=2 Tax=Kutzneria buriramensis TaxID=1045776 RepID=A0A3E0I018_9PSEU|nr:RHS repeat-associated protein [Kutzneria buriramensis]